MDNFREIWRFLNIKWSQNNDVNSISKGLPDGVLSESCNSCVNVMTLTISNWRYWDFSNSYDHIKMSSITPEGVPYKLCKWCTCFQHLTTIFLPLLRVQRFIKVTWLQLFSFQWLYLLSKFYDCTTFVTGDTKIDQNHLNTY